MPLLAPLCLMAKFSDPPAFERVLNAASVIVLFADVERDPIRSNLLLGDDIPMPTLPELSMRIASESEMVSSAAEALFVLNQTCAPLVTSC